MFLLERSRALWTPNRLPEHGLPRAQDSCAGHQARMSRLAGGGLENPNPWLPSGLDGVTTPAPRFPWCRCLWENPPLPPSPGLAEAPGQSPAPRRCSRRVGMANVWGRTPASRTTSFSLSCCANCRLQLDTMGRTQILVSCLDSDLGVSICRLDGLKHPVVSQLI